MRAIFTIIFTQFSCGSSGGNFQSLSLWRCWHAVPSVTGQSPPQILFYCRERLTLHVSRLVKSFQSHWIDDTLEGMHEDKNCC